MAHLTSGDTSGTVVPIQGAACMSCNGSGWRKIFVLKARSWEDQVCPECKGTGLRADLEPIVEEGPSEAEKSPEGD